MQFFVVVGKGKTTQVENIALHSLVNLESMGHFSSQAEINYVKNIHLGFYLSKVCLLPGDFS